ncbi:hypothetical protein BHM03_00001651 [Ensete ventricosum]|nr:hypothetical protein BHM03_00001651 [Ensete ventricosum]
MCIARYEWYRRMGLFPSSYHPKLTVGSRFRAISVEGGRKKKREKSTWSHAHYSSLVPQRDPSLVDDFFAGGQFLLLARGEGMRGMPVQTGKAFFLWV